jgi:hypothetical protein
MHWHPDDEAQHPNWTGNHFLARDLVKALASAGFQITDQEDFTIHELTTIMWLIHAHSPDPDPNVQDALHSIGVKVSHRLTGANGG